MSPRPDVSEERKNQILDAAQAVFARLGFHDARMDDIVEEAGLSKGALYWYFKSKDAIIGAILRRLFDRELRGLRSLLTVEGPIADRLVAYTRRAGAEILRTPGLSAIALEFYAVAARHKTVHAWLDDYYQRYRELLAGLIREGIAGASSAPSIPTPPPSRSSRCTRGWASSGSSARAASPGTSTP